MSTADLAFTATNKTWKQTKDRALAGDPTMTAEKLREAVAQLRRKKLTVAKARKDFNIDSTVDGKRLRGHKLTGHIVKTLKQRADCLDNCDAADRADANLRTHMKTARGNYFREQRCEVERTKIATEKKAKPTPATKRKGSCASLTKGDCMSEVYDWLGNKESRRAVAVRAVVDAGYEVTKALINKYNTYTWERIANSLPKEEEAAATEEPKQDEPKEELVDPTAAPTTTELENQPSLEEQGLVEDITKK